MLDWILNEAKPHHLRMIFIGLVLMFWTITVSFILWSMK